MLGSRILADRLENKRVVVATKGRDVNLVKRRNDAMVYRYYMYNSYDWSYVRIIETISEEFYLTSRTVTNILTANIDALKLIKREKPPLSSLSKKYPQFDWSIKSVE